MKRRASPTVRRIVRKLQERIEMAMRIGDLYDAALWGELIWLARLITNGDT